MPAERFTSRNVSNTSVEDAGSSAAVGSSSTSTRGRSARMAAMATFCFWPPESVAISRSRKSSIPTVSSACCMRAGISSCGTPKFSNPNSSSSRTFDATNWASISCNTLPTRRDTSVRVTSHVSRPSTRHAPYSSPAKWCGTAPDITDANVDLPAPDGPIIPTNSPLATASDVCSSAQRCAPEYVNVTSLTSMIEFMAALSETHI